MQTAEGGAAVASEGVLSEGGEGFCNAVQAEFRSIFHSLGDWVMSYPFSCQIILCAGAAFVIHVLTSTIAACQNYIVIRVGLRGLFAIRRRVFSKIENLSQRFFLRQSQGDVIYRVCWDTYSFQTIFQHVWFATVASLLSMCTMLAVMVYVNKKLTLIACITLPMLVLGIRIYGRTMNQRSVEAHKSDSRVASFIQQTIVSIAAIQSFVRQKKTEEDFSKRNREAFEKRILQYAAEIAYQATVAMVFALGLAVILWAGADEVHAGRLSVGELIVFVTYLSQFYEPLQKIIVAGSTLADARAGVGRVFEILDTPTEITSPKKPIPLSIIPHQGVSVEFKNVSFGYNSERLVLKNLSFRVEPGEFIAIVGPSGAGKTTMSQLISRFYDPDSGLIKFGGNDIRLYNLNNLRRAVSVVHQEQLIVPGTVRDNILFGCEDVEEVSQEELDAVVRRVHANDFIARLPKGYDTPIGDGECRLSVGEMQRLCLARALMKDAPILVLDEPTSSLDAENQRIVIETIGALSKGKTTFMIAHRLNTLVNASRVIVLVDGEVQAIGTHEELLAKSEYYRSAVEVANVNFNSI